MKLPTLKIPKDKRILTIAAVVVLLLVVYVVLDRNPCGFKHSIYKTAPFVMEPGSAVLEVLPDFEADPAQVEIELVWVDFPNGSSARRDVVLTDAPNLVQQTKERVSEWTYVSPDDVFTARSVRLWTTPVIANKIARASGATCSSPLFPNFYGWLISEAGDIYSTSPGGQ